MNDPLFLGGCLCGAVRYRIDAPLDAGEYCHCAMCRKASGAAFSANFVVSTAALSITAGADRLSRYASSANRLKCFCANCGSHLFIRRLGNDSLTVVMLGSLDDADAIPAPTRHVFVDSKAPWHDLDATAALPRYRIYPGFEPVDD